MIRYLLPRSAGIHKISVFLLLGGRLIVDINLWIVSKVKVLRRLDDRPHPFTKIFKVDLSFSFLILVNHKGFQVFVVDPLTEFSNDVFSCDETIVVDIQIEEGFSETCPVVLEFLLEGEV